MFTLSGFWSPEHSLLLTPPASRSVNCTRQGQLVLQRAYSDSNVSKKNHKVHTNRYFGRERHCMNLWINMEVPKTGGEANDVLIHRTGYACFLGWVLEGLWEELEETSYQIYSATKDISLKLEWDTVNVDLSFFICLEFINISYFICITHISSPNLSKIMIKYWIFPFFFTFIAKILKQWVFQAVWMNLSAERGKEQIEVTSFNIKITRLRTTIVGCVSFFKKDVIC